MKHLLLIAVCLVVIFSSMFIVAEHLGYTDEAYVREEIEALYRSPHGALLAATVIVGLLVIDLLLPVPSSVVMLISGMIFGIWLGTAISLLGSMLAAGIGFFACRFGGQRVYRQLVGQQDMRRIHQWFTDYGVYAIILSRPIPMMTEILSCLAGLTDLKAGTFLAASALGHLPVCLVYAYFGHVSSPANPWPAACMALLVPAIGWLIMRRINKTP